MRIANLAGRAVLVTADGTAIDIHESSNKKFGPTPAEVFADWAAFATWAQTAELPAGTPFDLARLGAPSPAPRQLFAIGLNYHDHAKESGFDAPTSLPPVFTKYQSAITGPLTTVVLPEGGNTDWEVELVAVIGAEASRVSAADAWSFVAGLTVGQDISERVTQLSGPAPQFSMGKSFPGFAPMGPWLVTVDEFENPDDLALSCSIDGQSVQEGRTKDLIFSVPRLIEELSSRVTLYPGDVIFTGTPAGVGVGAKPQRFLTPGEVLVSSIEGIGELRQTFVSQG